MALAFSSNDERIIQTTIFLKDMKHSLQCGDFDSIYEIEKSSHWIQSNGFKKVGLQFPDELLKDACQISLKLQNNTNSRVFILADTSYGSCCVDEVAAEHVSAEAIIHYGHSCLNPTTRLPILFVFCRLQINIAHAVQEFQKLISNINSTVIIFYDTSYEYAMDDFIQNLSGTYENISKSKLILPTQSRKNIICNKDKNEIIKCNRRFILPEMISLENCQMFYIGSEGPTLNNLIMTFNSSKFFSYDPSSLIGREESVNINKTLRKRYYLIERAKDAQMVGILVGTLGVTNYLAIINHLKVLIKKVGKKAYVFAVGKINIVKLANFPEIDIFVLVSCSENSFIDSKEFYQPILTPFELEMAYNQERKWTGNYVTDFSDLLPGSVDFVSNENNQDIKTEMSLISGKLRSVGIINIPEETESDKSILNVRNEKMSLATIHSNAAGEYLTNRTWRGLEQKLGETPVVKASEGKAGIAASYEGEGNKEMS